MSLLERMQRRQIEQDKNPVHDSVYDEQRALGQGVSPSQKDVLEGQIGRRRRLSHRVIEEDEDSVIDIVETAEVQRTRRARPRQAPPDIVLDESSSGQLPSAGRKVKDDDMDFEDIDDDSEY